MKHRCFCMPEMPPSGSTTDLYLPVPSSAMAELPCALQIERFVKHKLDVCRWVGLAVLIMQLLSLGLAYALSAAQQKLLDVR